MGTVTDVSTEMAAYACEYADGATPGGGPRSVQ